VDSLIPVIVWVFLVGPENKQVVHPHQAFESQKVCQKYAEKRQKKVNDQIICVKMINK
jgi:hypothetical protein